MIPSLPIPLIVADADIATTRLLACELGVAYPRVEVRVPGTLFGTEFAGRPIVFSRLCDPGLSWLPEYLRGRGIRYAYLLDDNFWELTPDFDTHLAPYYCHPAMRATLDRLIRGAAVVIVWSERLRDYIVARFPKLSVEFVPSGIDLAQVRRLRPPGKRADDGIVHIGYPTSRRIGVAPLLEDVVRAITQKYPGRAQFDFVGWMPQALEGLPNVTLMPHIAEYDAYLAFVLSRQWDVGLAPLAGVHFESFKTDVKFREYAAFGIAGVYSRMSPYTESVQHERTGVLVDNDAQAWVAALSALIESPRMREDIATAAFADIRAHRDLEVTGRRFAALLPSGAADGPAG